MFIFQPYRNPHLPNQLYSGELSYNIILYMAKKSHQKHCKLETLHRGILTVPALFIFESTVY